MNFVSDKITIQFYMFGALMEGWIVGYMNGRLIITVDKRRTSLSKVKIMKKISEPSDFTSCGS